MPGDNPRDRRQLRLSVVYVALALTLTILLQEVLEQRTRPREVAYDELLGLVEQDRVAEVDIEADRIVVTLEPADGAAPRAGAETVVASRLPGMDETRLLDALQAHRVRFEGKVERTSVWQQFLLGWIVPLGLMAALWWLIMRRAARGGPLSVGRNKAKIHDANETERVTFHDVAGVDEAEAELIEVVDFLKSPRRYRALGARIPKGVLLVGPPGTGKTLLAKAVAGEAGVPFFSISGSEFVEMFVGVGAARMRDLFEQAKARAPCIVFIDELDAIGKSRGGVGAMATHDEREQTLNQLLVEMDGFDSSSGVIIMAATNRPEVLDPALLRAGRFDRQVLVDRPDISGRLAILGVHVRRLKLGKGVNLDVVARRTPGMAGADLANVVNEAALAAARRDSHEVLQQDFEEAIDRIQLGLKKKGRVMTEDEKRRVAVHEAGHTLVALSVEHADPVHRVTIIPRSIGALGATLQLPTEERYLLTDGELRDRLCVMYGGRAAEMVVFGDVSTGAQNDIERATETARQMVTRFGMTERLGAVALGNPRGLRWLETPFGSPDDRNFSEETARVIDAEIRTLLDQEDRRARRILAERRDVLERLTARLLEVETLEREEILRLAGLDRPAGQGAIAAATTDH